MNAVTVCRRSIAFLRPEATLSCLLALAGIGVAVAQLYEPILFGKVINALTNQGGFKNYLLLWAGLGAFNAILSVFVSVVADRMSHRQRVSVLEDVFARTIRRPQAFHAMKGSGKLVRVILSGADQLFHLWLSLLREHVSAFVSVIFMVPVALYMNVRLALVLFVLAGIYVVANWFIIQRTHGGQAKVENHHQEIAGRLVDVVNNVTVVQSYVRFSEEKKALKELTAALLRAQYPVLTWWGILSVVTRVASTIAMMTIVSIGALLVAKSEITAGEVVTFAGFSGLLISRLDQISGFVSRTMSQAPTLRSFFELIEEGVLEDDRSHAPASGENMASVTFDNVSYRYGPNSPGVFNLNFEVKAGQSVALVGASGSGKSTSLGLLQRLYEPQSGRILIDGRDIREMPLPALRSSIAAVFQDAGLFNRSILENIRVGKPSATRAEVEAAARRAEAHDFIMQKPGGYDFVVGERGSALSGGERQRIAIARAILKDSPILILDEATSALDNETEKKIQVAIDQLRDSRTTFMIAHRLSTVVSADLILVFKDGVIVEAGSFESLRNSGGMFEALLRAGQLEPVKQKEVATSAS